MGRMKEIFMELRERYNQEDPYTIDYDYDYELYLKKKAKEKRIEKDRKIDKIFNNENKIT